MSSGEIIRGEVRPSYEPLRKDEEEAVISRLLTLDPEVKRTGASLSLITIDPYSPFSNLARSIESSVFQEFFDNDPELMAREYGPYERASLFFLVIDTDNCRCAGTMRILHPSQVGYKATNDLVKMGLTNLSPEEMLSSFGIADPDTTLEIATIAGAPDYRGSKSDGLVSSAMYRALYQYCQTNGYTDIMAVIDSTPLDLLKAIHLPVQISPDVESPFEYLDAKANHFIHIPIGNIEQTMKDADSEMFEYLLGYPGIDPLINISHTLR